jgi:hypothetical protein
MRLAVWEKLAQNSKGKKKAYSKIITIIKHRSKTFLSKKLTHVSNISSCRTHGFCEGFITKHDLKSKKKKERIL